MTARAALAAGVLCIATALVGCTDRDGGDGGDRESDRRTEPQPNGVAKMKPERALAVARNAMAELHDAVYESTYTLEIEGETRRVRMVETVTPDGCARVTSHPKFGRSWLRVIGRTMWLRTNDRAAKALGRTPAQIELFRGRWLKFPAHELVRGCDLGYLLPDRKASELVEATGMTRVDGRRGRRFRVEVGGLTVVSVIATEGAPLLISGRTVSEPGVLPELPTGLGFDATSILIDTDTGAEVKAPPERLVIDPADFQTAPA